VQPADYAPETGSAPVAGDVLLIDKVGRKPLVSWGRTGMTVALLLQRRFFPQQVAFWAGAGPDRHWVPGALYRVCFDSAWE